MFRKFAAMGIILALLFPVAVQAAEEVYLGGDSIGIDVAYDGVMVSGTYAIKVDGELYDPKDHGIAVGDIITAVNGKPITSMKELYQELSKFQQPINEVPISVLRKQKKVDLKLTTLYSTADQMFQSGLYIKDNITGVGTLTFYDPTNHTFGALGHEIMDSDLKTIADVHKGNIYPAQVTSITRAQDQVPGEKHASIDFDTKIGDIKENSRLGIYGTYTQMAQDQPIAIPWASQEEVKEGKAQIYTVLNGSQIQSYEITITKLHHQNSMDVKGIEFVVSDPKLLEQTNGIIQGMSGSPIVQDGKLIGAITHVITSDPISGYGVYIEWMLEKADQNK